MRQRRQWGPLVQVWVDVSERLTPYSQDYRVVLGELLTRLGRSRVEVVSLHKPGELNWFYDTRGRKRLNAPLPPPETHVLVLGDLGSLERHSSESRQRWLEFGRILRGRGCHPLALVPCALARVPLSLRQHFHVGTLAARRVPGSTPSGSLSDRLFTLLSFAIRIEPGLLRAVRRLLPEASDPGLEADVWQHPAIDRPLPQGVAPCGPKVVAAWIERFEQQPESLRRQVLQQFKRWRWSDGQEGLGPEIFFEEFARLSPQTQALSDARDIEDMCSALECLAQRVRRVPREDRDSDRMVQYLCSQVNRLTPAAECNPAISRSLSQIRQQLTEKDEQPPLPAEGFVVQIRQVGGEFVIRAVAAQAPLVAASGGSWLANLRGLAATVFWACAPQDASDAHWQPVYLAQDQNFKIPMPSTGDTFSFRTDCERVELKLQGPASLVTAAGRDPFGLWEETLIPAKTGEPVRVRWRWIPPGTFWQGSPEDEPGRWPDEGPRHLVTLTQGFWMADTPCTQALWKGVMGKNPSRFQGDQHPVESVSWNTVQDFLTELNQLIPGLQASLPTEAQWEYACRAGSQTALYPSVAGDGTIQIKGERDAPALDPIAWYGGNSVAPAGIRNPWDSKDWEQKQIPHDRASTQPVKGKLPNAWGLYDMLGNVYEWCRVGWQEYRFEHAIDPGGSKTGGSDGSRVFRGGSWVSFARDVRCASRYLIPADFEGYYLSFRLVRVQEKDRELSQESSET
jgi:formylglycine-generating enzyme required for sulfatase activity